MLVKTIMPQDMRVLGRQRFHTTMRVHKHAVKCKCYHSAGVSIERIQYLYVILYLCGKYRFLQSGYIVNTIATLQAEFSRYRNCNKKQVH